jgi:hypothetical protein
MERLVEAKQQRRLALAALPFPEKVRRVVELQKIAAPLWRQRGRKVRIWSDR